MGKPILHNYTDSTRQITHQSRSCNILNEFILTKDMLLILSPLILFQISLAVYCGIKIFREGIQNLVL